MNINFGMATRYKGGLGYVDGLGRGRKRGRDFGEHHLLLLGSGTRAPWPCPHAPKKDGVRVVHGNPLPGNLVFPEHMHR